MAVPRSSVLLTLAGATAFALTGCISITPPPDDTASPPIQSAPGTTSPEVAVPAADSPMTPTQVPPQPATIPAEVPREWTDTLREVSTGMTPITVTTCDSPVPRSGSGFLVSDTLVVTAAHVVEGATSVTVGPGNEVRTAEVIGYSEEADLALLRFQEPAAGHVFSWASEAPQLGDEVSALGYPLTGGFTSVRGVISSLDPVEEGFSETAEYIQTDAPVNPGNSGGPLITVDGKVVGVVFAKRALAGPDTPAEGTGYALSYVDAQGLVDRWTDAPTPTSPAECALDPGTPNSSSGLALDVIVASEHPLALEVTQSLATHGNAINGSRYNAAFNLFTPELQERMQGVESWQQGLLSTIWHELLVFDVAGADRADGAVRAQTWVRTTQAAEDGPDGQTCSIWGLDYTLVPDEGDGIWLIDQVQPREGPEPC